MAITSPSSPEGCNDRFQVRSIDRESHHRFVASETKEALDLVETKAVEAPRPPAAFPVKAKRLTGVVP
jgi:hypothetical protein